MRENPNIPEDTIIACLREQYGLAVVSVRFLPIGYDLNAFVYEALTFEGTSYFVKIRVGDIPAPGLRIPHALAEHGIPNILAPIPTKTRMLWGFLGTCSVVVYPFIRGENALAAGLSDSQWREFGATLKAVH